MDDKARAALARAALETAERVRAAAMTEDEIRIMDRAVADARRAVQR